jgi:hypothetical protein
MFQFAKFNKAAMPKAVVPKAARKAKSPIQKKSRKSAPRQQTPTYDEKLAVYQKYYNIAAQNLDDKGRDDIFTNLLGAYDMKNMPDMRQKFQYILDMVENAAVDEWRIVEMLTAVWVKASNIQGSKWSNCFHGTINVKVHNRESDEIRYICVSHFEGLLDFYYGNEEKALWNALSNNDAYPGFNGYGVKICHQTNLDYSFAQFIMMAVSHWDVSFVYSKKKYYWPYSCYGFSDFLGYCLLGERYLVDCFETYRHIRYPFRHNQIKLDPDLGHGPIMQKIRHYAEIGADLFHFKSKKSVRRNKKSVRRNKKSIRNKKR